jgi:UDP-N-acetylmuramate--alanine ligase
MYHKKTHIHFVGIGGIGMSGIAKILAYQGYIVSGCDLDLNQQSIQELTRLGCMIADRHNAPLCIHPQIDILVYSSAIQADHPEIKAAQKRGIPTIRRALMLAELMRTKFGIAIAGSHGKTTTTSLIAHILLHAKLDPTVIIGGHLKTISTNAQFGNGDFLVAEADESDRSLIHLHPTLAVITNIDLDHLETYSNLDDIRSTFNLFLQNIPFYGKSFLCIDDENIQSILPIPHIKTVTYGFAKDALLRAENVYLASDHSQFTFIEHNNVIGSITIMMPGRHNVQNTLAAIGIARELAIPFATIAHALQNFKGIERRFSFKGTYKGADIFDDYGHHPTEIKATLEVARKRTKKNLRIIFQPHRFSRTQALWHEFMQVLASPEIDQLVITDIYPASEKPIEGICSQKLVADLKMSHPGKDIRYISFTHDMDNLKVSLEDLEPGDLLLLLGAGKINQLANHLF